MSKEQYAVLLHFIAGCTKIILYQLSANPLLIKKVDEIRDIAVEGDVEDK